jgi:hypothetical protein
MGPLRFSHLMRLLRTPDVGFRDVIQHTLCLVWLVGHTTCGWVGLSDVWLSGGGGSNRPTRVAHSRAIRLLRGAYFASTPVSRLSLLAQGWETPPSRASVPMPWVVKDSACPMSFR